MRRVPSKHRNRLAPRQKEKHAVGRLASLLVCGLVLATGFVYAGVQHFGALRLGYQIQKLRSDLEKAEEEQKRLSTQREAAVSPVRLEQAARRLGMQPMTPAQLDPLAQQTESPKAVAPVARRVELPVARQPTKLELRALTLKSPKSASPQSSKQVLPVTPKAALTKVQEKPKSTKASADQKKSR